MEQLFVNKTDIFFKQFTDIMQSAFPSRTTGLNWFKDSRRRRSSLTVELIYSKIHANLGIELSAIIHRNLRTLLAVK